METQKSALT